MIRLNVYCSVVPSPRQTRLGGSHQPWLVGCRRARSPLARVSIRAVKGESNGGNSSSPGQSWDPGLEVEVPYEQRPVNEYSSLKEETLYSWGELGPGPFFIRLGGLWLVTFTTLGVPIAAHLCMPFLDLGSRQTTWFLSNQPCAHHFSVVKFIDPCFFRGLDNDMLKQLDTYLFPQVKPVIKMLKQTLVGTGAILVTSVLLFTFATPIEEFFQNTFSAKGKISEPASDISTKYNIRREELLRLPMEVKTDDELAASAAQAADGRPV